MSAKPAKPKLDGLRRNERAQAVVKYQSENEMPIGLRMISMSKQGMTYEEPQIRMFGKFLAFERCSLYHPEQLYRIEIRHTGGDEYETISSTVPEKEPQDPELTPDGAYRRLWEDHSRLDEFWIWYRKEFGEEAVQKAIDVAMQRQEMREAGEIE
jgi:hypothetical protein